MRISYSYGIMDLFHYGHLKALQTAAKVADLHVVGLVSDEAAKNWMGTVVSNEKEREAVLKNLSCVDWVMTQKNLDPTENLKKLHYIYPNAEITLFRGDGISIIAAREYLKTIGGKVQSIDYYERLAPSEILKALNKRSELSERHSDVISTKANTLFALKDYIKSATIEDMIIITVQDVLEDRQGVAEKVHNQFGNKKIVIRSSSKAEDNFESSNAGHFESVLDVSANDKRAVLSAIEKVYRSYGKDGIIEKDEQILIQSQTADVKYSGVVFTRDIQQNRPYYIINYDDSGLTDSVTGGSCSKNIAIAQNTQSESIPEDWKSLFVTIKELEKILSKMLLDIEFAITKKGKVVIFQVRPLSASYKFGMSYDLAELISAKDREKEHFKLFVKKYGCQVLSDMAFWNPSEIIGTNPHPMDYSLYRFIITHQAWNEGLVPMGYKKVDYDLMYRFGNKPYICADYAFLSLIPESLSSSLTKKLCDYYLNQLKNDLSAHDKIEFEIALSCFDFSTYKRLKKLKREGFSDSEVAKIRMGLFNLTKTAIKTYSSILENDYKSLKKLEKIQKNIEVIGKTGLSVQELSSTLYQILKAICKYGTPQFARQARFAFIARAFADSLKAEGYWSTAEYDSFMASIETIASRFEQDLKLLQIGGMPITDFNKKYGHLRAGTYDICKPRYDSMNLAAHNMVSKKPVEVKKSSSKPIIPGDAISAIGFDISSEEILSFMRTALEQREFFKYEFTKALSLAIEIIALLGQKLGYSRRDMSYFDINEILSFTFYGTEEEVFQYIKSALSIHKNSFELLSKLVLPEVLSKEDDFDFILSSDARPNFITSKNVYADVAVLDADLKRDIKGKIVVIEKADPGYDWIFTKGIAGLITKYGGVASHMAIRCAEFEIPAAIGCGEKLFSFAIKQNKIRLDCKSGKITGQR